MAPLIALVVVTLSARLAGSRGLGGSYFATLPGSLRAGVAALFMLTGGAHFIGMREELMRMVPPALGDPGFWVTFTGIAELAGAVGILIQATRRLAAAGLLLLLLAVFPANVHDIVSGGEAVARGIAVRTAEQVVYFVAVALAGFGMLAASGAPPGHGQRVSRRDPFGGAER